MVLSLRCGACGGVSASRADDVSVEIDFADMRIRYICPLCRCKNEIDLTSAKQKQKVAPLPKTRMS